MPSPLLVRGAFGLLILATVGAFFITQRLKASSPAVERVRIQALVSPNADARRDTALLRFDLPEPRNVTVSIVDAATEEVRRLVDDRPLGRGRQRLVWDGALDSGQIAADGSYRVRVTLPSEARAVLSPRSVRLDVTPPVPRIVAARPPALDPALPEPLFRVRLRFSGGRSSTPPQVRVYRVGGRRPEEVAQFRGGRGSDRAVWDGRMSDGRRAPPGTYAFRVSIRDRAGNLGFSGLSSATVRVSGEGR